MDERRSGLISMSLHQELPASWLPRCTRSLRCRSAPNQDPAEVASITLMLGWKSAKDGVLIGADRDPVKLPILRAIPICVSGQTVRKWVQRWRRMVPAVAGRRSPLAPFSGNASTGRTTRSFAAGCRGLSV